VNPNGNFRGLLRLASALLIAASVLILSPAAAHASCSSPANAIEAENCLPGTPQSQWDITGAGDPSIQGFATDISFNAGQTVSFKINTTATAYHLDIYRMGYYQGNGARLIFGKALSNPVLPSVTLPQTQPACVTDATTSLVDCGNWEVPSVTSALVGIAISEGYIKGLDDPITNYLPELKDQGFDAITIRNLLTMGSGIQYRIGFFPWDEFVLQGYYPNLRQLLLSDLKIMEPPGQSFHYNNFNTELIGMILERTTHRPPSRYLQEKIWKPIGAEYPATWSIDSEQDGFEITPTLLNARAIDLAKFGRLYLNDGNWDGKQIIPRHWVVESTTRDPNDRRPWETFSRWQDKGGYYKYFWWGVSREEGDYSFMGIGTYGQFIFVSPRTKVVIVRTADEDGVDPPYWREVFQYIADQIGTTD